MGVLILRPRRSPMFPPVEEIVPDDRGLVAIWGDLRPATILEAYRKGIFPWDGRQPIPWFSPDPRLILEPKQFHASKSLEKLQRQGKLRISFDEDFAGVISACSKTPRPGQDGTWITKRLAAAYTQLHEMGFAHSVEAWEGERLVGGLYGLVLGRAFFGESMFAHRDDASKLAFYTLCQRLAAAGFHFVDCQADTAHLRSLGAVLIPRAEYLRRLDAALLAGAAWGLWDHPA